MRVFLGLPLPAALEGPLLRLQMLLPQPVALVDPDDLHLTLVFLGQQDRRDLADLDAALGALALEAPLLRPVGLGVMGAGAVHVAMAPEAGLIHLQAKVAQAVRGAGIALPRARFQPHVTLGRINAEVGPRLGAFIAAGPPEPLPAARATELLANLVEVVAVDVRVAEAMHEIAHIQVADLRHHVGEQGIAGDVERHAQEDVGRALV